MKKMVIIAAFILIYYLPVWLPLLAIGCTAWYFYKPATKTTTPAAPVRRYHQVQDTIYTGTGKPMHFITDQIEVED